MGKGRPRAGHALPGPPWRQWGTGLGPRPLGLQSGLWAVPCHLPFLTWGVHLGQAAPPGLSPKPASAAPGNGQGHLRTGTKEPPASEHWALFDPNCQSESTATAWLLGPLAPAKAAPMEVFQEYPHRGQRAPEMKRLSLPGSLPFSTH